MALRLKMEEKKDVANKHASNQEKGEAVSYVEFMKLILY